MAQNHHFRVTIFSDVPHIWTYILKMNESMGIFVAFIVKWYVTLHFNPKIIVTEHELGTFFLNRTLHLK